MFKTIILASLTALIFVDGMSNASLDRLEPDWVTGAFYQFREQGNRATIEYPQPLMGDHNPVLSVLTGLSDAESKDFSLSDYYHLKYGSEARVYTIGRDAETTALLAGRSSNEAYVLSTTDSVVLCARDLIKRYRLGQTSKNHDLLIMSVSALADHTQSDIITTSEDEKPYFTLSAQLSQLLSQARIIMIGVPKLGLGPERMEKMGVTLQTFKADEMLALTNTYLMAIYGYQKWIYASDKRHLYLDTRLIDAEGISLHDILARAAAFVTHFDGIEDAEILPGKAAIRFRLMQEYTPFPRASHFLSYPVIFYPAAAVGESLKSTELLKIL